MKKIFTILLTIILFVLNSVYTYASDNPVYYGTDNAQSIYYNMSFKDIKDSFAKNDIMKMTALSVIRGGGSQKFYPKSYLKREEAIAYIVRLMGLEEQVQKTPISSSTAVGGSNPPTANSNQTGQNNASSQSGPKVDSWAQGIIDVAAKNNLLRKEDMALDFTANATREEVAYWIAKGLNLAPIYGKDLQKVYAFSDAKSFNTDYMPYIEAVLKSGIMTGYNDSKFGPKDNITREQMASVLSRAFNLGYNLMGYSIINATVQDILYEEVAGKNSIKKTFVLLNNKGQNEYIVVQRTYSSKGIVHNSDFLTISNGVPSFSDSIEKGDNVNFYINGQYVIFVEKNPVFQSTLYGEIKDISVSNITLTSESGFEYVFSYNPNTKVYINDYPASIKDLRYGQTVTVYLNGNTAYAINVDYEDLGSGKIDTGSRQVTGSIMAIDKQDNGINIKLDNGQFYSIAYDVPIIKDGNTVSLSSIKEGDYVNLYFDDPYTNAPIKVLVENGYHKVYYIIRGNLGSLLASNNSISINNVEKYYQGTWQSANNFAYYPLDEAKIYYNGFEVSKEDLKNYKGNQIYATVEKHFGTDSITFINITPSFTMSYSGIASFDTQSMILTLNDGRKVTVNDGTIILKDGMKIPYTSLIGNKQVYVSFSQTDRSLYANFISVIDSVYPEYYYAKGFITSATSNSITIGNLYTSWWYQAYGYYAIQNNQWNIVGGTKTFYVGDKTYIVDNRDKDSKVIPYTELLDVKYGKSKYTSAHVYVVSQGDNAIAINIMNSTGQERVSTADVVSIDGTKLTLNNVNDWNELNGVWNLNTSLDTVDVSKTVIIKNGQAVNISSINPGDSLYIIRNGSSAVIVTVK
ncbi:S-layer homology domain-containing protein [Thermoanaerobacter thermohydrosulfuricus]|uniref:S-layer domain containing protein n=2 Tax=Thermoanaerobacter thermohydrosulfuricus TaxID=1516 RepID=M8CYB8_THETY|nr:S-layer domain containing protein [Thermoanaerobacter thermohydrosulfuricus WC1]SDF06675.1 S-layer homology domain-containing protein [Thermoanaerobacter thermohydrosulfuricus]